MDKAIQRTDAELALIIAERFGDQHPNLKQISAKDFKTPKADFVVQIFVAYLKLMSIEITGIPSIQQTEHLTYIDAYQDILPYVDLYFALRKIYEVNYVNNLSMTDLIKPNYKRTTYLLSMLENFIAFYEMKSEELADEVHKLAEANKKFEDLEKRKEKLRQEINNRDAKSYEQENRILQLEQVSEDKAVAVNKLLAMRKENSDKQANDEAHLHEYKRKAGETNDKYLILMQEIENLKKLVVQSQLSSELKQQEELLDAANLEISAHQDAVEAKKKQLTSFEMLTVKAAHLLKLVQQFKILQVQLQEREGIYGMCSEKVAKLLEEIEKCRDSIANHTRDISQLQEELAGCKLQGEKRMDTLHKSVKNAEEGMLHLDLKCKETLRQFTALKEQLAEFSSDSDRWFKNGVESGKCLERTDKMLKDKEAMMYTEIGQTLQGVTTYLTLLEEQAMKEAEEKGNLGKC